MIMQRGNWQALNPIWVAGFFLFLPLGALAQGLVELKILTYDSFMAEGALGPEVVQGFEKNCTCKVRVVTGGDGGQLLQRLKLDGRRNKYSTDLVIGLDQHLFDQAEPYLESFERVNVNPVKEPWARTVAQELWIPKKEKWFIPYDFGVFAWIVDQTQEANPPTSLEDLLLPRFKKKFILEDPRSSTPGLAFLLFTIASLGKEKTLEKNTLNPNWGIYWKALSTQWLTMSAGWDQAYGAFLKGQAPLVWSYLTSQSYHSEKGQGRYKAVLFETGQPVQVEGLSLVKSVGLMGGRKLEKAQLIKKFVEYWMSIPVQSRVPKTQWMFPARSDVVLPKSFQDLPKVKKMLRQHPTAEELKKILDQWNKVIQST